MALKEFRHDKDDTIIWFISDHGDQLGETLLIQRKGYPLPREYSYPVVYLRSGDLISAKTWN